jgi:hypothetical protein
MDYEYFHYLLFFVQNMELYRHSDFDCFIKILENSKIHYGNSQRAITEIVKVEYLCYDQ